MFIIKLFILLFIFHFHYSSLVGCFFPAGHLWACWFLYTLLVKLNSNSFPKVLNPFPKVLLVKLDWNSFPKVLNPFSKAWGPFPKALVLLLCPFPKAFCGAALFQRLLFCFGGFGALFQRLFVVQPFSKGMAWLRSFPKPFGGCLFQSFYLLNFKVSLHCLSKVTENHALRHITMPAPLCADGKNHQATLQALLGHLWWIIKNHRGPKVLADFLFSPWTCPFPSAVNFQLLEQVLGKEVPGIFLDLPFPFFTFHIAHYVDLFGGLDQPP